MSAAPGSVVDLVVQVLDAAKVARTGVGVPLVEAERIVLGVRQQQQTDVAAERRQLVRQDGPDPGIL